MKVRMAAAAADAGGRVTVDADRGCAAPVPPALSSPEPAVAFALAVVGGRAV
jgi:hypothetical protein